MTHNIPRIIKFMGIAFAVLMGLLVLFVNSGLADLAEWLYAGGGPWTHVVLLAVEIPLLAWFWFGLFGRHRHLLLMDTDTPEKQQEFVKEFLRRMQKNPHIQAIGVTGEPLCAEVRKNVSGRLPDGGPEDLAAEPSAEPAPAGAGLISPADAEYIRRCLRVLNAEADAEIQKTAKRIFLATALSQNGRIDALIMFASLCRLVWRISAVYNQQPHPREILSLYWAVVSSTFLALSIEELDIATEITVGFGEAFQAVAPAGITTSIPFAGKALQTFTASTIDGSANCYLALRAGIITRNAYTYKALHEPVPSRAAVFKEAGGLLLGMSQELVGKVAGAVASSIVGAAAYAGKKTVQTGVDAAAGVLRVGQEIGASMGSTAEKVTVGTVSAAGTAAEKLAASTVSAAEVVGKGIVDAGAAMGKGVVGAGAAVGKGMAEAGSALTKAGLGAGAAVGSAVGTVVSGSVNLLAAPFRKKKNNKK